MGGVARKGAEIGGKALGVAKYVFPVTALPLLAKDGVKLAKKLGQKPELPELPEMPTLQGPDLTDDVVRKARLSERNRQLAARGRQSTFLTSPGELPTVGK